MNADTKPEQQPGPHRRLGTAFAKAGRRMRRGGGGPEPVWTRTMTALLLAGMAVALLASLADEAAIRFVLGSDDAVVRFMAAITNVGRSQWYLVPAGLVFLAVGMADWSRGGMRGKARLAQVFGRAGYVFACVALSGILVNVLKVLFGRARPRLIDEFGARHFDPLSFGYLSASFPSGHATTVGAMSGVLMVLFPRWWALIGGVGLFVAATRIAALAHYPSDVAAGFLLGLVFSVVLARWLGKRGLLFRLVPGKVLPVAAGSAPGKPSPARWFADR